ncbi:MAG: hypothetical protein M3297_03565 [Thermoproteota archaeon]|nr:hypothetical protein [Thermoproteota archaeon]
MSSTITNWIEESQNTSVALEVIVRGHGSVTAIDKTATVLYFDSMKNLEDYYIVGNHR